MSILSLFALAVGTGADQINIPKLDANVVLNNGLNIFYLVTGIIAVVVIILAGYSYTTSMGDAAAVSKAKDAILYSVVGLVVIIMAFAVTWFVIGRFI